MVRDRAEGASMRPYRRRFLFIIYQNLIHEYIGVNGGVDPLFIVCAPTRNLDQPVHVMHQAKFATCLRCTAATWTSWR